MSDFLFADSNMLTGAGRVMDIGASMEEFSYNYSPTAGEADERALQNDWAAVGNDLAEAMRKAE